MMRFKLRTLLFATAILALPCAWYGHELRSRSQQLAFAREFERAGLVVETEQDWISDYPIAIYNERTSRFVNSHYSTCSPAEAFDALKHFPAIKLISLTGWIHSSPGGPGGERKTTISSEQFATLREQTSLEGLQLQHFSVSDWTFLREMGQIKQLTLADVTFDDEDVALLADLRLLEQIRLFRTQLTPDGAKRIRGLFPNVKVVTDVGTANR